MIMRTDSRLSIALAALITAAGIFMSCDSDIAYTLEGTWEGDMFQEYIWEGTTYCPSYTQVTFLKDPYTYSSGDGYWVDYFDSWIPWKNTVVTNHIDWTVRDGNIFIHLFEDNIDFIISDYHLDEEIFRGELSGSDGSYGRFRLHYAGRPFATRSTEGTETGERPQRVTVRK